MTGLHIPNAFERYIERVCAALDDASKKIAAIQPNPLVSEEKAMIWVKEEVRAIVAGVQSEVEKD
jgi:hypothetical protein